MHGKESFPLIEYTNETTCRVIFPTDISQSGYALGHNSAGNGGAVGSGYTHTAASAATTWNVSHNLGNKHCSVDVAILGASISSTEFDITVDPALYYNIKGLYDNPVITFVDENNLTITFATAMAGKAVITYGEVFGSQVQAVGTPHMEVGDDATAPSSCPPVTINNGGAGFVAGDVGKVYTVTGGTGTSATVTIATVVSGVCTAVTLTTGGDYTVLPTVISCSTTGASGSVGTGLTLDLNFKVKSVVMSPAGDAYQTAPTVIIGAPTGTCGTGTTATGTPTLNGEIVSVNVVNPGSGYASAPVISFTGGGGAGAVANSALSNSITGYTITNSGTGYSFVSPPIITFPAPSSPPLGVVPVTATGTAVVNASGNVRSIIITQGGTGYSSPADDAAAITIAPSGVVQSLEITDTGYGYTGQPFVTYAIAASGAGASQIDLKGFLSRVQITDFGSGYLPTDTVTFADPAVAGGLTATGNITISSTKNFTNDIKFNMSDLLTYEDGYQDPKKALITFFDSDNDMVPDDPLSFDKFVNTNRYMFQETYTDFDGYIYYQLTKNVLEAINQTQENTILSNGADYVGKYIYRSDAKEFKKISATSPYTATTLTNDADGALKFKAYIGRSRHVTPTITATSVVDQPIEDVFFQWKHYAPIDQRVDPSVTNLIDVFVLTRTYHTSVLTWRANNSPIGEFPVEPTTTELAVSMDTLSTYKSISDEIIYKPVKFKLLFGPDALAELQATFKIIKVIGSTLSDNELRSQVVAKTNDFFNIENWELGESFYYTELAAYIHQNLSSHLSSIVIVPIQAESNFGNLFQVKAEPDELFISVADVNDVEVVKGFTEQNLKIR